MEPRSAEAVEALVRDHLPLVGGVARRAFPGLARDPDLLQWGRIGLWQAARTWDGERPFRPYACACIRRGMGRWTRTLRRWSAPVPAAADPPVPGPEERVLSDLALAGRIAAAWPPGTLEHWTLTQLAAGVPKDRLAAALGRSTWSLTRMARRAWRRVPGGPI